MFRFTIRDMLWLTAVVGLSLGWWLWWRSIPQDARLAGSINFAGQALADGRVCFVSADGQIIGSTINNGDFRVARIPVGSYRVLIEGADVPAKYSNGTFGLTADMRPGRNEFKFGLAK